MTVIKPQLTSPTRALVLFALCVLTTFSVSVPSAAAAPYEPNDSSVQATGPLMGGITYSAALETSNDEDWFYFYTAGQVQLDVALTKADAGYGTVAASLLDTNGQEVGSAYAGDSGETDHVLTTAPTAARYLVQVRHYAGINTDPKSYQLRIDPPGALTATPPRPPAANPVEPTPSGPSAACSAARSERKRAAARVRALKSRLIGTRSRRAKRRLRRSLVRAQRALQSARSNVAAEC